MGAPFASVSGAAAEQGKRAASSFLSYGRRTAQALPKGRQSRWMRGQETKKKTKTTIEAPAFFFFFFFKGLPLSSFLHSPFAVHGGRTMRALGRCARAKKKQKKRGSASIEESDKRRHSSRRKKK